MDSMSSGRSNFPPMSERSGPISPPWPRARWQPAQARRLESAKSTRPRPASPRFLAANRTYSSVEGCSPSANECVAIQSPSNAATNHARSRPFSNRAGVFVPDFVASLRAIQEIVTNRSVSEEGCKTCSSTQDSREYVQRVVWKVRKKQHPALAVRSAQRNRNDPATEIRPAPEPSYWNKPNQQTESQVTDRPGEEISQQRAVTHSPHSAHVRVPCSVLSVVRSRLSIAAPGNSTRSTTCEGRTQTARAHFTK